MNAHFSYSETEDLYLAAVVAAEAGERADVHLVLHACIVQMAVKAVPEPVP